MTQYIDKSAVVAEIEKIIADETESIKSFERRKNVSEVQRSNAKLSVLYCIRSFLSTLEVKEVDLGKELDSYFAKFKGLEKNNWNWRIDSINIHAHAIYDFAKHFFELGFKNAQKGE